jgi:hypothetical protein
MFDPKARVVASHKKDSAKRERAPISILSRLQAENTRLRQQLVELELEILVLKEALKDKGVIASGIGDRGD